MRAALQVERCSTLDLVEAGHHGEGQAEAAQDDAAGDQGIQEVLEGGGGGGLSGQGAAHGGGSGHQDAGGQGQHLLLLLGAARRQQEQGKGGRVRQVGLQMQVVITDTTCNATS